MIARARERHQAAVDVANQVDPIVALQKQIDDRFKNFLTIRNDFDNLLDNNVQPATMQQLNTASATAIGAAKDADVALRVLIGLGLAVGLLAGIATTRVVIRHIRELTLGVQAMKKGDLSSRVTVRPRHEFATLCESFNSMAATRAQAEASLFASQSELQAKVETRTVDLHRVNQLLQQELDIRRVTEKSPDLAAAVFNSASDAIVITDDASVIVMANKAFERITGYGPGETIGKNVRMLSDKSPEDMSNTMTFTLRETGHRQGQRKLRKKDGNLFPAKESISLLFAPSGQIENQIWVFSDITPLKRSEEQLRHLAHHDSLTGLPNRLLFAEMLQNAIARTVQRKEFLGLFFLDLDRFKIVNDTFGHGAGDALLRAVAVRLRGCVRDTDVVARLGGDEFTIILEGLSHSDDFARSAEKVLNAFNSPIIVAGHELIVTASIGISVYPKDASDAESMLINSDTALHAAKAQGKNCYRHYAAPRGDAGLTVKIEQGLRQAIAQDELFLQFQPQKNAATGELVGLEALVRWKHPKLGILYPVLR